LIRISKIFLTSFLTVAVGLHVIFGIYASKLLWPAPLYAFYALLFVLYSMVVTRRYTVTTIRVVSWCLVLVYAMWFYWLSGSMGLRLLTSDIRDLLDIMDQSLLARCVAGAAVAFQLLLGFAALWKRFGFIMAYRVFMTGIAVIALALKFLFQYSVGETGVPVSRRLSDWFLWAPETEVKEFFELVAVNSFRVIIAEMAVTSFAKCFRGATDHYNRLNARRAGTTAPKGLGPLQVLADAVQRLGHAALRSGILVLHFIEVFARTFAAYLWAVWRVMRRIAVDFVIPLGSLVAASFLLALLSEHSASYVTGKSSGNLVYLAPIRSSVGMILMCIVGVYVVQLVFLAAVAKFRFKALMRCNLLLGMWLAPFALTFFVLVSVSLTATGFVVRRHGGDEYPYHLGPLTMGAAAILALLVAGVLVRGFRMRGPVEEPTKREEGGAKTGNGAADSSVNGGDGA
jgi:hypothetical protein